MKARPIGVFSDFNEAAMVGRVPGWKPGTSRLDVLDRRDFPVFGLPDKVMVTLYKEITAPRCRYIKHVWDCENIARWAAVHVAELWARLVERGEVEPGCLNQGAVMGSIPVPNDLPYGDHAAQFFFNNLGQYRIFEYQTMRLLSAEEVARTQAVWTLERH